MRFFSFFLFNALSFLPVHPHSMEKVNHVLVNDIQKPIEKKKLIKSIQSILYYIFILILLKKEKIVLIFIYQNYFKKINIK